VVLQRSRTYFAVAEIKMKKVLNYAKTFLIGLALGALCVVLIVWRSARRSAGGDIGDGNTGPGIDTGGITDSIDGACDDSRAAEQHIASAQGNIDRADTALAGAIDRLRAILESGDT